jgi:hypothetical protein
MRQILRAAVVPVFPITPWHLQTARIVERCG